MLSTSGTAAGPPELSSVPNLLSRVGKGRSLRIDRYLNKQKHVITKNASTGVMDARMAADKADGAAY